MSYLGDHTHFSRTDARGGETDIGLYTQTLAQMGAGAGAKVHRYTRSGKSAAPSRGPPPVQQMMRMYGTRGRARLTPHCLPTQLGAFTLTRAAVVLGISATK